MVHLPPVAAFDDYLLFLSLFALFLTGAVRSPADELVIHTKHLAQCLTYRGHSLSEPSAIYNTFPSLDTGRACAHSPLRFVTHLSL